LVMMVVSSDSGRDGCFRGLVGQLDRDLPDRQRGKTTIGLKSIN